MSVEPAGAVFGMPFRKNPRDGQKRVFDKVIEDRELRTLNIKLPTGYGKSFVSAGVYSIMKKQGRVNRLLTIVPTVAQRNQFINDAPGDMQDACVSGPLSVIDIGYFGIKESIKRHRNNSTQLYIITAQGMLGACGEIVREMMQTGSWMVTVDEYHHYGIEKSWGYAVKNLPHVFLLAMSATPYRREDDSAFGPPVITVNYRAAVEERAVKRLLGHSYVYRIDMLDKENNIVHMTTDELIREAGTDQPTDIENYRIERKMRWSPKYISPLVAHPIERMIQQRIETGYKLQVIIGAMCVTHAKMVCDQVRQMFPDLKTDWVGTGEDGRSEEDNRRILRAFCPPKDTYGRRSPTLDILVQVGMAGEGLDSVYVSEIVHLNRASVNNSNNQENGRAARYLENQATEKPVEGNINFDSCSEFAEKGYIGSKIMDAMDCNPPSTEAEEQGEHEEKEDSLLPEEPTIHIWDMELDHIDSGSPEIQRTIKILKQEAKENYGIENLEKDLADRGSSLTDRALLLYKNIMEKDIERFNEQSIVEQWQEQVKNAVASLTHRTVKMQAKEYGAVNGSTYIDQSMFGMAKKKINQRKKFEIGEIRRDVETLRKHYTWVVRLEKAIVKNGGLPEWLR